jgi:hypothetical protein
MSRTVRLLLILSGVGTAAYGGRLLLPQLPETLPWLLAGPLLHDLLLAPLVGLIGLALSRLLTDRVTAGWIRAALLATAVLLLIAVPLVWRPAPAPPNPGLQDRNYLLGLAVWLAALWVPVAAGCWYRAATGARRDGRGR